MQINNINEILNESDVWVEHNELVPCGLWGNMVVVHFTNLITREDIEFDAKGREEDIVNFRKIHSIVSSDLAKEYIQKREERESTLIKKLLDVRTPSMQILEGKGLENQQEEIEYRKVKCSVSSDGAVYYLSIPLYGRHILSFISRNIELIEKINNSELLRKRDNDPYYSISGKVLDKQVFNSLVELYSISSYLQKDSVIKCLYKPQIASFQVPIFYLKDNQDDLNAADKIPFMIDYFQGDYISQLMAFNISNLQAVLEDNSYACIHIKERTIISNYLGILKKFYDQIKDWKLPYQKIDLKGVSNEVIDCITEKNLLDKHSADIVEETMDK